MPRQKVQAFIFDMDGTLVNTMPIHNQIWVAFFNELGVTVDAKAFYQQTAGKTNPEILRHYLGSHLTDAQVQELSLKKEIRYRSTERGLIQPIPGALDFLQKAREAGIPMALATSAGTENIQFIFSGLPLDDYFEVIVHGEEIRRGKPDPEIFITAAERMGIPARRCLVFEDAHGGIQAAQSAGMQAVAITTGMMAEEAKAYPNVRLTAPDFLDLDPQQLLG